MCFAGFLFMTRLERRVFFRSLIIGACLTLLVLLARAAGLLDSLEDWLYDARATYCQIRSSPPTTRLAFVDIDDPAVATLGRWPWRREVQAKLLSEIQRAHPSAVGLDIMLSEPDRDPHDDELLADALKRTTNPVLAASIRVEAGQAESSDLIAAVKLLKGDLEISPEELRKEVDRPNVDEELGESFSDFYAHAVRLAMAERINEELDRDPNISRDDLFAKIVPHADANGISPLKRVFTDELKLPDAAHKITRFGAPIPELALQPVQGVVNVIPMPIFSQFAQSVAFANFDIFDTARVRSVPLYVQYGDKLYPQFGFATACAVIGADPAKFHLDGSDVVIPSPQGEIRIPTVSYHSRVVDRDVPLIAQIPWFGTSEWETMFDWPDHKERVGHMSAARVWDVCDWEQIVEHNSGEIDRAFSQILDNDRADKIGFDSALGKKYRQTVTDPMDVDSRTKWSADVIKQLNDLGWIEQYKSEKDSEIPPDERVKRDNFVEALSILNTLIPYNRELLGKIKAQRQRLDSFIGGKGILIGFTATGMQDQVSTSLHQRAPGVIVHGVIANAVLTGQWWHSAPTWIEIVLTIIFGLTTAEALGRYSAPKASLLAAALMVGYAGVNGALIFGWFHWILGMATPLVAIAIVWAGCTLYRVTVEALERRRVALELAATSREMDLARQVQVALIPSKSPKVVGLESEGWALTASVAGGDCYDLWQLKDGRLAVLLADASGHGLAPAMVVSQVRTLCRSLSDFENTPYGLLARVNRRVSEDLEANRFVTAFLGFLDSKGVLEWASAGHGPMYWNPGTNGKMLELDSTGLPLGIQPDCFFDPAPEPLQLEMGGSLVVFSDGIFEAPAPDGNMFGVERVKEILETNNGQGCGPILAALRSAVQAWQQKLEPVDDQTIVVVRRVE
jgi:serine phosphatase RsbU (regulator of sigma subunit)/CHASE2 domain-containing sensor protein